MVSGGWRGLTTKWLVIIWWFTDGGFYPLVINHPYSLKIERTWRNAWSSHFQSEERADQLPWWPAAAEEPDPKTIPVGDLHQQILWLRCGGGNFGTNHEVKSSGRQQYKICLDILGFGLNHWLNRINIPRDLQSWFVMKLIQYPVSFVLNHYCASKRSEEQCKQSIHKLHKCYINPHDQHCHDYFVVLNILSHKCWNVIHKANGKKVYSLHFQ